jgi:hypothetical protein
MSDRDDGLLVATSFGEPSVLRGKVTVVLPNGAPSALDERRAVATDCPWAFVRQRRFPALS